MQFRCPNCQQPIRIEDNEQSPMDAETFDTIECPSCRSRFSLSSEDDTTLTFQEGLTIGHFEIRQVLGEGAFGTVFKAWDTELQRFVALKVPREGRITKETSKLFLREARAVAGISHPNVVAVYEMGQHGERFYIASELIEGITLSEYLRDRLLDPVTSARFMIKILHGVAVFHEKGIIHRDLKPGNILLDNNNEPHISDFGLAQSDNVNEVTVTNSGRIVGTLLYMSPEQARGENRLLTTRSDIYALGVILFELLTGKRPFQSTTSRTLLHSILTEEPARPRAVRKAVPRDLETICLKAMEKDPASRFSSASEMAEDLQRFLDNKPILARPVSAAERFWRLIGRHRMVSALTALLLPLVGVLLYFLMQPPKTIQATPLAHQTRFTYMLSGNNVPAGSQADWTILPLHPRSGEPVEAEAMRFEAATTVEPSLAPGGYLVIVDLGSFGFHEVYRYVPEDPTVEIKEYYAHRNWEFADDDTVVMPPIVVRSGADVISGMVAVPGGTFEMGDGVLERLKHTRNVADFLVDPHEVTAAEFEQFIKLGSDYKSPRGNYPVSVHWDAATAYAEFTGKRLLDEAEFEYLARDLGQSDFPTGNAPAISSEEPWVYLEAGQPETDCLATIPVFGIHSNVAEWTSSLQNLYPGMPDPGIEMDRLMNKQRNRIVRGGPVTAGPNDRDLNSWGESVSHRSSWDLRTVDSEIGFRCARSAKPRFRKSF